jgi:hypothetical protein
MPSQIQVSAILLVASVVWGAALMASGTPVGAAFFKPLSTVSGALVLALSAFDVWLWRVPALQGWFVRRPFLWGTWRAEFRSNWVDPTTGERIPPKVGYMLVRQTYRKIRLRLMTDESTSELLVDDLVVDPDGTFRVFAVYRNESKLEVRERSPIHYGALALTVQGSPVQALVGFYWTDRNTRGDIEITGRVESYYDSFSEAHRMLTTESAQT